MVGNPTRNTAIRLLNVPELRDFPAVVVVVFNHPTFVVPVRNINARNAGAITDASLGREIQFSLE